MPRKKFICDPTTPYHLVGRCNNRDWFDLPLEHVWEISSDYLFFVHNAFKVRIHSFVLMSNHFHLIASFPDANLSSAMQYFMRESSRAIAMKSNRINHIYGTRVFRSRLGSFHYYQNTYKYVFRNPVRAGEVAMVHEYKFSTLRNTLGLSRSVIPTEEDTLFFNSPNETLKWLNAETSEENWIAMKKALRRADFKLPKLTKRLHSLETQLL